MVKIIGLKTILLMIAIMFTQSSIAMNDSLKIQDTHYSLNQALQLLQCRVTPELRTNAIEDLKKYAASGSLEAIHGLGMVYYIGIDTLPDLNKALNWFTLAADFGYPKSAYNLSTMYRQGLCVKQDFNIAYKYACEAADRGFIQAVYTKGYLLYKGLGCNQNYDEAINCFKDAASKGHGYAMYMLGLCYRNGYGVSRDMKEAYYWLKQAADKNIKASSDELALEASENPLSTVMMKVSSSSNSSTVSNKQSVIYNKVKHTLRTNEDLHGVYSGTLITYDWSGKYAVKESPLFVTISQSGDQVIATWKEDTLTTVEVRGQLTDSALVFSNATYSKNDHYTLGKPTKWNFLKANLKSLVVDGKNYLAGELQLYSPDTNEPGKPMYLSLEQKTKSVTTNTLVDNFSQPRIYPNPFVSNLTFSFWLNVDAECSISVFTLGGIKLYEQELGKVGAGMHRYQLDVNLLAGNYTVKLNYGDKVYNTVVIKK